MRQFHLKIILKRDATFGRGDGVAGLVDTEVMYDDLGLPYLGGRAIKGILVNECADILAALPNDSRKEKWLAAAARLFGSPGSTEKEQSILFMGDARLPEEIRTMIALGGMTPADVLETLTAIRQQTALEESGVYKEHSLRTQRVILRETPLIARILFLEEPTSDDLALLHACIKSFRRAGTSRNRGLGLLEAIFLDQTYQAIPDDRYYLGFRSDYMKEGSK
ncbi:MAG TPA: hypothetical protein PLF72_14310 [Anaerolineaceae bacterium]|nr:hypothetical protein [Anaerolineaceae bacterium]